MESSYLYGSSDVEYISANCSPARSVSTHKYEKLAPEDILLKKVLKLPVPLMEQSLLNADARRPPPPASISESSASDDSA